jgi:hypothetical protein
VKRSGFPFNTGVLKDVMGKFLQRS